MKTLRSVVLILLSLSLLFCLCACTDGLDLFSKKGSAPCTECANGGYDLCQGHSCYSCGGTGYKKK